MLQITPNSRPAFQPDMIEDRIRELREIAKPIVQHYQSDLGHDENALREHPHVKEWLWVPYPNGTHIASLNPRGKNWGRAILEHCQSAYRETPTPYLITPQGVTATTWERVKAAVERLTDPTYEVQTAEGETLITTTDWYRALRTLEYHKGAATLRETSEPKPLLERDTPQAERA